MQSLRHGGSLWGGTADSAPPDWMRVGFATPCGQAVHFVKQVVENMEASFRVAKK